MNTSIRGIGAVTSFVLVSGAIALAQDWPQWRGPNRDANVTGFNAPKEWPKELTKKWSKTVGSGVSSPVLVGDKLYAFGRIDGDEVTTCLDAASGNIIWQDKHATKAAGGAASGFGGPRGTPAVFDGKVFTLGVNGTVTCLSASKGDVVWRKETGEKPGFGTSMSPLVVDGKCIVFLNKLMAFDAANGDVKWTGASGTPYGSPSLMTVDGAKMVVTPTADMLIGASLTDGKTLWQKKLPPGGYTVNYTTPIIHGETVVYVSPAKGGAGSSMALKIVKDGDAFKTEDLWKGSGSFPYNTPVLKDGLIFGLTSSKSFFCMDAKTGKVLWTDDTSRGEAGGVLNAGKAIIALTGPSSGGGGGGGKGKGFGRGGESSTGNSELVVFEPSGEGYKELAKYQLMPGSGLAYPIVAGNRIYVKSNTDLTLWTIN